MSAPLLVLSTGKTQVYPQPVYRPSMVSRRGRHWISRKGSINGLPVQFWHTMPGGNWFYFSYRDLWFRLLPSELPKSMRFLVVNDLRAGGEIGEKGKWAS